jgi:hypothetical protein
MKKGSKEFEELRQQFESDIPRMPIYVGGKIEREAKDSPAYYTNGKLNDLFNVYILGYQCAKCLARMGALNLNE